MKHFNKIILVLVFIFISASSSLAQTEKPNNIFLEILGNAGAYSINYDRKDFLYTFFTIKNSFHLEDLALVIVFDYKKISTKYSGDLYTKDTIHVTNCYLHL